MLRVRTPHLRRMKLVIYAVLFLIFASLIAGIVIGLLLKLIWLTVLAAVFVVILTWLSRLLRGRGVI